MREADNIREVEALRPDWMGFIFWPKSSRYVSERPAYLPTRCRRVGVFVDEEIETVRRIAHDYALDIIQLHGQESPDYARQLKDRLVVKAFNIATADDLKRTACYEGIADYFLFDTKGPSVGGNGVKFDWSVLDNYQGDTSFLLSGGIGPDDASALHALFASPSGQMGAGSGPVASKCLGIDLNSRFETAPGLKDIEKLKTFIQVL